MRSVYVAGPSQALDSMAKFIQGAERSGLRVTHDWVQDIQSRGVANPGGHKERRYYALTDLAGVKEADYFFFVQPADAPTLSVGAGVELGYAAALEKPIYAFGYKEVLSKSIFPAIANSTYDLAEYGAVCRELAERPPVASTEQPANEGFKKHDSGKSRVDLISPHFILELGDVLGDGARKYGDSNWRRGTAWSRYLGAGLRHTYGWASGHSRDPESGRHQLVQAACSNMFLFEYERLGLGTDDRSK